MENGPLISWSWQWSLGNCFSLNSPFPGAAQEFPPAHARNSCVTASSLGEVLAPNLSVRKPVPKIDRGLHCSGKAAECSRGSQLRWERVLSRAARSQSRKQLDLKTMETLCFPPKLYVLNKGRLLGAFAFDELRGNHFLILL